MTRLNNGKIYAVIAAICYVIDAVLGINLYIINIEYEYKGELVLYAILIIIRIAIAVILLIGNKKGVVGALGAFCLMYIACSIFYYKVYWIDLSGYIDIGVYVALLVIGILMLCGKSIVKKIWFIPGVVAVAGYGYYLYTRLYLYEAILENWQYCLFALIWCGSVIFVGLWLMKNVEPATGMRVNEYIPNNMRAPYPSPTQVGTFGGAYKQKVYCRNCGAEMQDNENFCFKCGAAKEPNIANKVNANHQNI